MNKLQLKALMSVNLRLVNPQITDRYRKKGSTGRKLTKKLANQFLINTAIFLLIYGLALVWMDFSKMPGMFTFYLSLFVLLGFSQSISGIYNIFFAGKDLPAYLPLPFREKEIFFSKVLIVISSIIPFTLPMFLVFLLTAVRSGIFVIWSIFLSLLGYLLILSIIILLCALIVFGLTKTTLFKKHQNTVMGILMWVTMIIAIGGIVLMNSTNQSADSGASHDRPIIGMFMPIFRMFHQPSSISSLITWGALMIALIILGIVLIQFVLPHISEQLTQVNTVSVSNQTKKNHRTNQGLHQILNSYNFGLLKEPNLLLQVFSSSILFPLIFVVTIAFARIPLNLGTLPAKWLGLIFVAAISFSVFSSISKTSV